MKFRNYCVVALGKVDGCKEEIIKIAESDIKFIKSTGVIIATFSSVATPSELKTYFQSFDRNFVLFELGKDNYGANLTDISIYNHLFGEYDQHGDALAEELTTKLFKTINSGLSGDTGDNIIDIDNMTNDERTDLLNKMLDKGVENWNDSDKIIVEKLTKK